MPDNDNENAADLLLMAKERLEKNELRRCRLLLEILIDAYPTTPAAQEAREILKRM